MTYPLALQKLISFLRKFPGVGKKSAERFAFQLISWKESDLLGFSNLLSQIKKDLLTCNTCKALFEKEKCPFCDVEKRDFNLLCVVASAKDIFTIESTGIYNGLYHVIPGLLSPVERFGPSELQFSELKERLFNIHAKEVILALDSTIEGDATALFLKKELNKEGISVSRLAMGMPLGSSLDFLDEGTLSKAFSSRLPV
ncbi:MAG: recombination protein RecR [Chlamydiae bacterium]|jgi:recombination protein RecR|nr:recombination protein RecR [Chlamydiota bacterium]